MENINGIPVYTLSIDTLKEEYGVSVMSFVESPAVEKAFIALSEEKTEVKLSVNAEKRIVTGVALRANYPIKRYDEINRKEYFFVILPEAMEDIMQKFMREKRTDAVNIMHDPSQTVEGVYLIESFILSDHHKLAFPEFADVETGSWMVSYKVDNDNVWKKIQDGRLNGFSVELVGDLHLSSLDPYSQMLNLLSIINSNEMKLSKTQRLKLAALGAKLGITTLKLESIQSGDVTLYYFDTEEPEVGQQVYVMDEQGAYISAPDGDYPYNGNLLIVRDGVIERIDAETPGETIENSKASTPGKLQAEEATLVEVAETVNAIIDLIEIIVEESDEVPDVVADEADELKLMKEKLAAAEDKLQKVTAEVEKTKDELKLAQQTSNGTFTPPNPSEKPEKEPTNLSLKEAKKSKLNKLFQ